MEAHSPTADLMTVPEVAKYLNRSPGAVYQMVYAGKGPRSAKLGGRVMFRRREVDAWIEAQFAEASA